jgi:hypothetical protein
MENILWWEDENVVTCTYTDEELENWEWEFIDG